VVWIPDHSVLFAGDLIFNGGTPFLLMGSVTGTISVLEEVIAPLNAQTIVPGHGAVFHGRGPLDDTLDYLRFVLDLAARAVAEEVPPLAAARDTDLGRFASWPDRERIVGNLHRACAELRGTRPAAHRHRPGAHQHGRLQRRRPSAAGPDPPGPCPGLSVGTASVTRATEPP
jgi:cyclase